ncbi:MAG: hypothetical protein JOY61_16600 [Chloroflexi bacterium]|nr:hypothetical protein [Chloroflexota bacterium]
MSTVTSDKRTRRDNFAETRPFLDHGPTAIGATLRVRVLGMSFLPVEDSVGLQLDHRLTAIVGLP